MRATPQTPLQDRVLRPGHRIYGDKSAITEPHGKGACILTCNGFRVRLGSPPHRLRLHQQLPNPSLRQIPKIPSLNRRSRQRLDLRLHRHRRLLLSSC